MGNKMSTSSKALLKRVPLLPDESLVSLLTRLTHLNFYPSPSLLIGHIVDEINEPKLHNDRLDFPVRPETYEKLSSLTLLDSIALYKATPHHFAQVLASPPDSVQSLELTDGSIVPYFPPTYLPDQIRPLFAGQFCPACLKEGAYHRLTWMPTAVSACLRHKCLLIDRCYVCHEEVSISAIVGTHCKKCKADLTKAKIFSVENDQIGILSQQIIQSWLMQNATPLSATSLLPGQPPAILYRVIEGLQSSVKALETLKWPYLHRIDSKPHTFIPWNRRVNHTLSPFESYLLYTTAFKVLMNWPDGFFEFLHAYQYEKLGSHSWNGSLYSTFNHLYTHWLRKNWLYPEFNFVQNAFKHYFTGNYWIKSPEKKLALCNNDDELTDQITYVPLSEASYFLETTINMIELLLRNELLTIFHRVNDDKYVSMVEVLKLRRKWHDPVRLDETAELLGVTKQLVIKLVKIGLLSAELMSVDGSPQWAFKKSAVLECLESISRHVQDSSLLEADGKIGYLNLSEALKKLSSVDMDVGCLLAEVTKGKLYAYHPLEQRFQLTSLLFKFTDIHAYQDLRKPKGNWLSREEVIALLRVKNVTFARWMTAGRITPVTNRGQSQFFDPSSVEKFNADYISIEEASRIVGVESHWVKRWARANWFSDICVSGPGIDGHDVYLFEKERLVQWRNERLTCEEAEKVLGVSSTLFQRWFDEKRVRHLEKMSNTHYWFSKQEILKLKDDPRNSFQV